MRGVHFSGAAAHAIKDTDAAWFEEVDMWVLVPARYAHDDEHEPICYALARIYEVTRGYCWYDKLGKRRTARTLDAAQERIERSFGADCSYEVDYSDIVSEYIQS